MYCPSHPVVAETGVWVRLQTWLDQVLEAPPSRIAIVTDDNVGPLYADRVAVWISANAFSTPSRVFAAPELPIGRCRPSGGQPDRPC